VSFVEVALKPRSLLIATDFSETSERLLRHSLAIARFYGSKFCLAHVVSSLGLMIAGPGAIAACEEAVSREAADLRNSLIRTGALGGIEHNFIVRRGELWPELREIARQERADLIVVGTHGRHGIGKLLFGSVAEQICRQADCPVLTFGPHSYERPWVGTSTKHRTFLFATDFGQASLGGLPHAIAVSNHFGAKLCFLSVVPAVPQPGYRWRRTAKDLRKLREDARMRALRRLAELAHNAMLDVRPEFYAVLPTRGPVSECILETAERLEADLVIMGIRHSDYTGVISHLGGTTAYDVASYASSPVLTVNCSSQGVDIGPRALEVTASPLPEADLIRIHSFGVKWYPTR
jgi:nucleotide-binding universal stress UspA family protein